MGLASFNKDVSKSPSNSVESLGQVWRAISEMLSSSLFFKDLLPTAIDLNCSMLHPKM